MIVRGTGRGNRKRAVVAIGAISLIAIACAANSSSRSRMDRANRLMDDRHYVEAVDLLEREYVASPSDRGVAVLLAQAHLGKAKVEMFQLVRTLMETQDTWHYVALVAEPKCDPGAIQQLSGMDLRCVLFRALQQLPEADDPDMARARSLLREAYPDAAATPTEVNFLAAFVEFSSALTRLRALAKKESYSSENLEVMSRGVVTKAAGLENEESRRVDLRLSFVLRQLKLLLGETQNGFKRLRYSYKKLNQFVVSLDGKPLIQVGSRKLLYSENLGAPEVLRFLSGVVTDSGDAVNAELGGAASEILGAAGAGPLQVLDALGVLSHDPERDLPTLRVFFRFEAGLSRFLNAVADASESGQKFNILEMAWANPPGIFHGLATALAETWENEGAQPIRDYYTRTESDWQELFRIADSWRSWWEESLDDKQRSAFQMLLRARAASDPRLKPVTPSLEDLDGFGRWQRDFVDAWSELFEDLKNGKVEGDPGLTALQLENASQRMADTRQWLKRNLWLNKR